MIYRLISNKITLVYFGRKRGSQIMAKHDFFGGLAKFTVAAAAVAGVCYAFKDEIRGTKTYKDLNEKYDVDSKLEKAAIKAKESGVAAKAKIKETATTVKSKVDEKLEAMKEEDEMIDDSEIILAEDEAPAERDYVSIKSEDEAKESEESPKESKEDADGIELEDASTDEQDEEAVNKLNLDE